MSYLDNGHTEWFACECCTHALSVTDFNTGESPEPDLEIALWGRRYAGDSFRSRVRDAWRALRGRLYTDNILLDHKAANRLGYHLIAVANPHHSYGCPRDGEPRVGDCEECEEGQRDLDALPSLDP